MRALQMLLTGMWVGSVAATAVADAERRGPAAWEIAPAGDNADVAGSGGGMFDRWPDFTAPVPRSNSGAEADVALPVFLDETGGPATGTSTDPAAGDAGGDGDKPLFGKGTWSLQLTGSYYTTVAGSDVTLAYGTASLGYYYADTWAIDVSLSGYALEEDDDPEGVAASLGLNLRKHFIVRDPWSVYIDGGVGIIRADGEFPAGGTHTNFTLQAGLGATYRLTEVLHLVGGARWFHISNARRHGEDENASTDGVAVYGGLMWTW